MEWLGGLKHEPHNMRVFFYHVVEEVVVEVCIDRVRLKTLIYTVNGTRTVYVCMQWIP